MEKVNAKNRTRASLLLCSLLLAAGMLLVGCDTREKSAPAEETVGMNAETGDAERQELPSVPAPEVDVARYRDLVISKVYGNGESSSAACLCSFIELTNTGDSPLELGVLALYYRTTGMQDYLSFPLPDTVLGAGERFLIRGASAAKKGAENAENEVIRIEESDAEWRISLDNREIRLALAPAGRTFDGTVPPEELPNVISYFAATDGYAFDTGYVSGANKNTVAVRTAMKQDSGYYLQNLTKTTTEKLALIAPVTQDGERAAVVGSKLREIRFSHAAGFYDAPIGLELTAPEGYGKIYYTTDGSDPASSRTRKEYAGTIELSETDSTPFGHTYTRGLNYVPQIASYRKRMVGAHVVKACAYDGEHYTGIYTNTYFIGTKLGEYGVSVMSVSLETDQMFGNPGFYHRFNPSSNDPNTRGEAFMEVFDEGGVRRGYSNVELAASGHGSSGAGMRSMKVFYKASQNTMDGTDPALHYDLFDGYATNAKGQTITEFSRLVLRNSGNDCGVSYIRDAYMQRVSRDMAADTMAYAPVLVFVNGDFWGVYNARERYSADYVESHYGIERDNVALIESDYAQVHTNQNAPFIVSSGLEDDADDFNELVRFIRKNDMTKSGNYDYVLSNLDVDSLIDLFVSRLYFSALDFPGNNIKLWQNRAYDDPSGADNRWHFVLLDMDMGISFYKDANNTTETSGYFGWLNSDSTVASGIIHRLLMNETFKDRFMARFYQALNEDYAPARLEEELDRIVEERAPIEYLQTQRWAASMNVYNDAVADMRRFVQRRKKIATRLLCAHFGVREDELAELELP